MLLNYALIRAGCGGSIATNAGAEHQFVAPLVPPRAPLRALVTIVVRPAVITDWAI